MSLFAKDPLPYYIWAPPYTHTSSGVRTLYSLCDELNEAGQAARIILGTKYSVSPGGRSFIAVYPDIVRGNQFCAKHVVRYLLAPAGAYGGDKIFPETDNIWGALPSIAKKVLRLPVSDPNIFFTAQTIRGGSCFYSHKYEMHGNTLLAATGYSMRLQGSLEDIAAILRTSEVCYVYEVSSIITEAALCGCPVVLMRTPYFNTIDPDCMMGEVRWSDGEIVKKCDDYLPEYMKIVDSFPDNLEQFIKDTQAMA